MATTLRNPEAPATRKQLWLLHILTKEDTTNSTLTMQQASDKISELKKVDVKPAPNSNGLHYCIMYSCAASKHRMSNGKRKWKALCTTKDKKHAIKDYNVELDRQYRTPSLYPTSQVVIVECRAARFARKMLLEGKSEYIVSTKLWAKIIKDSRIAEVS